MFYFRAKSCNAAARPRGTLGALTSSGGEVVTAGIVGSDGGSIKTAFCCNGLNFQKSRV